MSRRAAVFVVGPLVVAIAGWLAFSRTRSPHDTNRLRVTPTEAAKHGPDSEPAPPNALLPPTPTAEIAAPAPSPTGAPPRSLDGTEPDGSLETDAHGHFVPTRDALRFFDYFLSTTGERSPSEIRALVSAAIAARLGEPAGSEALAFYDRYVAYHGELTRRTAGTHTPRETLAITEELRRTMFGPELATRLFGVDEAMAELAVEANEIATDRSLSAEQRRTRMQALEARMPEEARAARSEATLALDFEREEREARARGASANEIAELRTNRYGPEAADRLSALDARRDEWARRVDAYRDARDRLVAGSRDQAALARAVEALRAQRFEGPELLRVRALDHIDGFDFE